MGRDDGGPLTALPASPIGAVAVRLGAIAVGRRDTLAPRRHPDPPTVQRTRRGVPLLEVGGEVAVARPAVRGEGAGGSEGFEPDVTAVPSIKRGVTEVAIVVVAVVRGRRPEATRPPSSPRLQVADAAQLGREVGTPPLRLRRDTTR